MAGISSKAAGSSDNKKEKFQGQEFTNDFDICMYEFKYRMDDCQTGRFWQIDPLAEKYEYNSTYAFSENHVTGHVELEGLEAVDAKSANVLKAITTEQNKKTSEYRLVHNYNGMNRITHYNPNGEGKVGYLFAKTPRIIMLEGLASEGNNPNRIFSYAVASKDNIEGNYADISITGAGNTFRHLLLSSMLTATFGESMSKRITDMKERDDTEGALSLDNKVDLLNNSYGRQYATDLNLNLSDVIKTGESAAEYLNNLAIYTLASIPEYANNSAYKNILSGKEKLFSADSESVKTFIEAAKRLIDENQKYVTDKNKKKE